MPSELQHRYVFGRRAGKERRTSPRYPFTATCDATEPKSKAKIIGRTSDLGRGGCYIDTIGPFPPGTTLIVRINQEHQTLTMNAKVAFAQPGMGMGLAFLESDPEQQKILDLWISELSGEPIANSEAGAQQGASISDSPDNAAKSGDSQPVYVMHELVLLLLQKGVLTESEGKSLLQKLLK